jgi:DNA-directed RNA polymerase subunit RPC12/RpoP
VLAHTICGIYNSWSILCKKDQCGGGGIRTHEPLRDGITHLSFFSLYVLREEMVPRTSDLESCAFDQASLPLRSLVLPVKPYFIVAASEIRLNFAWCQYNILMPKPETVSRLCIKCHSKTVHEVREKTMAGIKLVCTDCGHSLIVATM